MRKIDASLVYQGEFITYLKDIMGIWLPYEDILQKQYSTFLREGNVVFDLGAHIGLHTQHFIDIVKDTGRVICFEPVDYFAGIMRDKFAEHLNVEIHNCAVYSKTGTTDFWVARGTPEESGIKKKAPYVIPEKADPHLVTVSTRTLDEFIGEVDRLDYIKIDIEGAECDALEGGLRLIEKFRPIISFEYGHPGYSPYGKKRESIYEIARSLGYSVFDLFGNKFRDRHAWCLIVDRVEYWDFFMCPEEKKEWFLSCLHRPSIGEDLMVLLAENTSDDKKNVETLEVERNYYARKADYLRNHCLKLCDDFSDYNKVDQRYRDAVLEEIYRSKSWRFTRPLRETMHLMRRVRHRISRLF